MTEQEVKKIAKEAAKEGAKEGIHEVLKYAGYDMENNPQEFVSDLTYLKKQRESSAEISKLIRRTALSVFVVGILGMLWVGFVDAIKGGQ